MEGCDCTFCTRLNEAIEMIVDRTSFWKRAIHLFLTYFNIFSKTEHVYNNIYV